MTPRPPTPTLFPYTTLFRSPHELTDWRNRQGSASRSRARRRHEAGPHHCSFSGQSAGQRSEEHTSELQSLTNLVCRLLLEKKNSDDCDGNVAQAEEAANSEP